MKKALKIINLSLIGLLLGTGTASASIYSNERGENPCLFALKNLKNNGYSIHKAYTAEEVHQLLNRIDVDTRNVDTLAPGSYQLAYSCYVDNHLAHATLQALPVNNPTGTVTNIFWTATKPAP